MAHYCWWTLFWLPSTIQFFVATMIPSLVTVIWIFWKSGPTCTKIDPLSLSVNLAFKDNAVCELLDMHDGTHACFCLILWWNERFYWRHLFEFRLFIASSCKALVIFLDISHFYLPQFTSIHCDNMSFYLVIYSYTYVIHYVIHIYVFCCAIFICKLCANVDKVIYMVVYLFLPLTSMEPLLHVIFWRLDDLKPPDHFAQSLRLPLTLMVTKLQTPWF